MIKYFTNLNSERVEKGLEPIGWDVDEDGGWACYAP